MKGYCERLRKGFQETFNGKNLKQDIMKNVKVEASAANNPMEKSRILFALFIGLFLVLSLNPKSGFGQRFYFKAAVGGGIGVNGSDFIVSSYTITDSNTFINNSKVKYASLGNGIAPTIAVGYNIGKNFSFELALGYNKRFPITFQTTDHYNSSNFIFHANWEYKYQGHSFFLVPAFTISPNYEKFNPYCKIGLILSKGSLKEVDSLYALGRGYTYRYSHYTDIFYGLKSALGVEIPVTKKMKLFVEAAYDNVAFLPSKTTLTSFTSDGTDLMWRMNVIDKETIYVDEINADEPSDVSSPRILLQEKISLNTITLTVGIKI